MLKLYSNLFYLLTKQFKHGSYQILIPSGCDKLSKFENLSIIRDFHAASFGAPNSRSEIRRKKGPYQTDFILHYPEYSRNSNTEVNWMFDKPQSSFEGYYTYGPNTLQVKGLPPCTSPEYMQERLRKFFSKYGTVAYCRCIPHPLDPYQCEGSAYITFRDSQSSINATYANIILPPSLQNKILKIRHLETNKENNPRYFSNKMKENSMIIDLSAEMFFHIIENGPIELSSTNTIKNFNLQRFSSVISSFTNFLNKKPLNLIFKTHALEANGSQEISLKTNNERRLNTVLRMLTKSLRQSLINEFTIPWRFNKPSLPSIIQKKIKLSKYKPPLNPRLQILSRSSKFYNIYDERYLFNNKRKLEKKKNTSN